MLLVDFVQSIHFKKRNALLSNPIEMKYSGDVLCAMCYVLKEAVQSTHSTIGVLLLVKNSFKHYLRWLDWIFLGGSVFYCNRSHHGNVTTPLRFLFIFVFLCTKSVPRMQVNKIFLTRDRPEQFSSFFVRSFQ